MRKYIYVLCAILICFVGYSAFRIESSDAKELHSPSSLTVAEIHSFSNTKNTLYDKYLSDFNFCQPITISDNNNSAPKGNENITTQEFSTPINKLNIQEVGKSNILLFSKKNLSGIPLNKTTLKDTNILVLKELGTSTKFDFSIYNTNDLINNIKKPMISGEIQNNKVLNVVYN